MKELQATECWFHSNYLFINITKTETILFGSPQKHGKKNQFSLSINASAIKCVTEFKQLNVFWDEHRS